MVHEVVSRIKQEIKKVIIDQEEVIDEILVVLIAKGHVLLEGVPGLAKTLIAKVLAKTVDAEFRRVQFTPDLMPSDVIGTNVFDLSKNTFSLKKGPIFTDFLLADEINRTPPKTQSSLLEAMEERAVTIDGKTHTLSEVFMVFATQNPIEYEGTYPLPESQLDRFMLKILIDYPTNESAILKRFDQGFDPHRLDMIERVTTEQEIIECRKEIQKITVWDGIIDYITKIVKQTRNSLNLALGGSPRASIYLMLASKALAGIRGKTFVTPDDVKSISKSVLRHRIILKPEAELEGLRPDDILEDIVNEIEVPR